MLARRRRLGERPGQLFRAIFRGRPSRSDRPSPANHKGAPRSSPRTASEAMKRGGTVGLTGSALQKQPGARRRGGSENGEQPYKRWSTADSGARQHL